MASAIKHFSLQQLLTEIHDQQGFLESDTRLCRNEPLCRIGPLC